MPGFIKVKRRSDELWRVLDTHTWRLKCITRSLTLDARQPFSSDLGRSAGTRTPLIGMTDEQIEKCDTDL